MEETIVMTNKALRPKHKKSSFSLVAQSCPTLCRPMDSGPPYPIILPVPYSGPPCPSTTPKACSNSCPSSQWCHPVISSSVVPLSSCLQSFPESGSFQMSQHFASGGQSIGVSNISPSKEYSRLISFRMNWLDLLAVKETLKSLLQHHNSKASILWCSAFFIVQLSHPYMTAGKPIALAIWTFVGKVTSLLSRLVITFEGVSIF